MNVYIINNDISIADWKKMEKLFAGKDSKLIDSKIDDSQIENLTIHSASPATTNCCCVN